MLRSPWERVAALAVLAGAVWLPFAGRTLSPDEGGLLIVGGQWSPGVSVYGDYFVDRPPLLVALFSLVDGLGGSAWALRRRGVRAGGATVLRAGATGRAAGGAPTLAAATAAVFVATPLFGATVVNAEVLGLPFVLGGVAAALMAGRAERWLRWALLAGALGACAVLVKQSILDAFVFAAVLLVLRRRWGALGGVALGGVVAVAVAVALATTRGTSPADLWQAVVVFRSQAAEVIAESATGTTASRFLAMLTALLVSIAPALALALAIRARRSPLLWPTLAMLAWELFVVFGGGSYWLHYLLGLVPGLVLLAAAAPGHDRFVRGAYLFCATSTVIALVHVLVNPIDRPEEPAIAWLDEHTADGDTAVVAFGAANILRETGLPSPYPDLWSLPVRVHDPDLASFASLLASPERPTWVVVVGASLQTWGVDGTSADEVLAEHYSPAVATGRWTIYRSDAG